MLYRVVVALDDRTRAVGEREARFARLVAAVEPSLRRALVAAYGPDTGRDAAAEALAWAWEHLDRLDGMANPAGYLWRVAQSSLRRQRRAERFETGSAIVDRAAAATGPSDRWDDELVAALRRLTTHQRVAIVLVHAYGYHLNEAAAVLDCRVSTLRNHLARGLEHVRRDLDRTDP